MDRRSGNAKMLLILSIFSITLAVSAFAIELPAVNATSLTSNVVANVIISNTCFISVPSVTSFYGGNVYPGLSYNTNVPITDTDSNGNSAANVFVAGTGGSNALIGYWFLNGNTLSNTYFGISNTLYSISPQTSWTGTALTNTLTDSHGVVPAPNTLNPTTSNTLYFGLNVPSGQPAGNYAQGVIFENSCNGQTPQVTVTFNTAVGGVCYISLSPNSVSFGTLLPAASYNTNQVIVDSDSGGNAQATILIAGIGGSGGNVGDWFGQTNVNDMIPVGNTLWNPAPLSSYAGNALSNTLTSTSITIAAPTAGNPTTSANVYLGLGVPGGTPSDTYVQNVLFENTC